MVGSPFKGYDHMLSSVPKAHFHRLGRNFYSLHASGVPSRRPIFDVWDGTFTLCMLPEFRPGGPFSSFGTELLLPACFRSSVLKACFHPLGRNFHDSRKFREISGCLEHGTSSTPRIISNEKQSPNGLCFIVGGDGGSRTHVQEYFRKTFSERSRLLLFRLPVALRQTRGSLSRRYSYATGRSRKRSLHA